jgi:hypothetical protein
LSLDIIPLMNIDAEAHGRIYWTNVSVDTFASVGAAVAAPDLLA